MPAIQLDRLKIQSGTLAGRYGQPEAFANALHEILEEYSDRTFRPTSGKQAPPAYKDHRIPVQVIRQIVRDVTRQAKIFNADQSFILLDRLWSDPSLEARQIAITILGQLSSGTPDGMIERIERWDREAMDDRLRWMIVDEGMTHLFEDHPEAWRKVVSQWFHSERMRSQRQGLRALLMSLRNAKSESIFIIYSLLEEYFTKCPIELHPTMLELMNELYATTPGEYRFFLQTMLKKKKLDRQTERLLSQSIDQLPLALQKELLTGD